MFIDYKKQIERLGFRVMATTSFDNGDMSFDAHWLGRKRVIKGDRMPTPELAMVALLARCENANSFS